VLDSARSLLPVQGVHAVSFLACLVDTATEYKKKCEEALCCFEVELNDDDDGGDGGGQTIVTSINPSSSSPLIKSGEAYPCRST
jgi:hypothetical protein